MEDAPVDWWAEARAAALVTVFVALLGAVVGVVWHAVAPPLDAHAAFANLDEATKPLIGDDLWLAMLGAIAGAICAAAVAVSAPYASGGPGAQVGLVVGGVVAMLVADRVGYLIGLPALRDTVNATYPQASPDGVKSVVSLLAFKVRAHAVLLTWPMASIVVSAAINWVRAINQPTLRVIPSYPGSP